MKTKLFSLFSLVLVMSLIVGISGDVSGAATSKTLSTTYTLANMGSVDAIVSVEYLKDDGTTWAADLDSTTFTLAANGGQKQIRQYFDTVMAPGRGSAVISSSEPLAAIVLLLARNQTPTSGGYEGSYSGDTEINIPLIQKNLSTSSGLGNSQLVIQNMDDRDLKVSVEFIPKPGTGLSGTTKNFSEYIAPGVSLYYDLDGESLLTNNWIGAAVVTAKDSSDVAGKIGVVSNLFVGPDLVYTINGFGTSALRTKWYIPYFTSKLVNGQNTSIAIQNLSGGELAVGTILLDCTPDSESAVNTPISLSNTDVVVDKAGYEFNSLALSATDAPAGWHGSCVVTTTTGDKNLAVAVYVRHVGNLSNGGGAGFGGIGEPLISEVDNYKTIVLPYLNKRLANGVATVISVENIGNADATVTLTYKASEEFTGDPQELVIPGVLIKQGESLVRNYRMSTGEISEPSLPNGWFGSLTITSDQPLQSFTFVTNFASAVGDTYFGFNAFPIQ